MRIEDSNLFLVHDELPLIEADVRSKISLLSPRGVRFKKRTKVADVVEFDFSTAIYQCEYNVLQPCRSGFRMRTNKYIELLVR